MPAGRRAGGAGDPVFNNSEMLRNVTLMLRNSDVIGEFPGSPGNPQGFAAHQAGGCPGPAEVELSQCF